MKTFYRPIGVAVILLISVIAFATPPDPPLGKRWEKIEKMSDEFDGTSLDGSKWIKNDPQWAGRVPAKFKTNAVTVADGNLKITNYKMTTPEGAYTHGGGLVRSVQRNLYGYYETRMKANKTFMSSTFWLINKRNEFTGCDYRTTELDITENVGVNTGGKSWIDNMVVKMNSNTHSRGTSCPETPVDIKGGKADLGGNCYDDYHIFAVWWKNATECVFYLDNEYAFSVNTPADFDLPMYLRMVTETYDWNPVPADGGMTGTEEERTTYYDWTRSWRLVDGGPIAETVDLTDSPGILAPERSYEFNVAYTCNEDRDLVVQLWSPTEKIGSITQTVEAPQSKTTVTMQLDSTPHLGTGYILKAALCPVGGNWNARIDSSIVSGFEVATPTEDPLCAYDNSVIMAIYADSEDSEKDIRLKEYAVDGDPTTFWHTQWFSAKPDLPHEIHFDLGEERSLDGIDYLARQDEWGPNGAIGSYEIYVSNDNANWGVAVASGTFNWGANPTKEDYKALQSIVFDKTYMGRYVKLVALTEAQNDPEKPFTNIAELTFKARLSGIEVSQQSANLEVGSDLVLSAKITPVNDLENHAITWRSTNETVATVSGIGTVLGKSNGEALIIASVIGGRHADTCTVKVSSISSLDENLGNQEILLYPNPTTGILNIANSEFVSNINIIDIQGRIIKRIQSRDMGSNIKIDFLENGVYLAYITLQDNSSRVIQIIKQ